MKGKNVITINGRLYDAITGMPVAQVAPRPATQPTQNTAKPSAAAQNTPRTFNDIGPNLAKPNHNQQSAASKEHKTAAAHTIHQKPQRSQTLYRAALKRPTPVKHKPAKPVQHRSPVISHFGPGFDAAVGQQQTAQQPTAKQPIAETPPTIHPAVAKALAQSRAQTTQNAMPERSSKELKAALIKERLAEIDTNQASKKEQPLKRRPKLTTVLTSTLAVILLGGYLTFINLPNISMRVAATRAGIAASFPSYRPDGYSFQGPITYAPGEVSINFKSNTSNNGFTVKQKASNWDSQAVLDNYVTKHTENYLTYQEQGLTIYSFDNKAAWVNGGLLYSLEGDAQLSSEQVLRLATSL